MNISSRHKVTSLADKREISTILKYGTKVHTSYGPVFFYNQSKSLNKKAAVLVKKNIGKAYYRNYIKRIIRFYIRTEFTLFTYYNRVIFLYRKREKTNFKELQEEYNIKLIN